MNCFITGAAGFIGSHLADRLLVEGHVVTAWDNFSTGSEHFIQDALSHPNYKLVRGDNLDLDGITSTMAGADHVFHFAANADVRFGLEHPRKDLEQNTIATFNVLEAMRANNIKVIFFASTGAVYGGTPVIPTPEDLPFPIQTSLYGASKLAGESLIQAYCEGYGFQGFIFRFVSMLGERYTHGHIFDFYRQLLEHPERLNVLGDGSQRKSYIYVHDCIDAMLHVIACAHSKAKVEIFNLGTTEYCCLTDSIRWICAELGLTPELNFSGGKQGWIGDNPFVLLDTRRILATGWRPSATIRMGVERTVRWLRQNEWALTHRV
ncbi:MAG: NAD-dependent epimerase/dehydratase family protein [Chthoniobacterales bacterium]